MSQTGINWIELYKRDTSFFGELLQTKNTTEQTEIRAEVKEYLTQNNISKDLLLGGLK